MYFCALDNGWIDQCFEHIYEQKKLKNKSKRSYTKWTLDKCRSSARKYKTRSAWRSGDKNAYIAAGKYGFRDLCTKHMNQVRKAKRKSPWTLAECLASAKKYKTRSEWRANDVNAYNAAGLNKWRAICCQHMQLGKKNHTLAECKEAASKFRGRTAWFQVDSATYNYARRYGWLDECSKYFKKSL